MIELFGIGIARHPAGWLLRNVSATLDGGQLVAVGARTADERGALLDVITARTVPAEGRLWVDRVPLMPATVSRLRASIADIDAAAPVAEGRSVLWNVMAPLTRLRGIGRLLRLPRRKERTGAAAALTAVGLADRAACSASTLAAPDRLRLHVARALAGGHRYLAVRDLDRALPPHDCMAMLVLLRSLTRTERRIVVVGLADPSLASALADRFLLIEDGSLRRRHDVPAPAAEHERRLGIIRT